MFNITPTMWINLLPINWRSLERVWNSVENYKDQLALDIDELIELWLDLYTLNWEVTILDIWWNNSTAIKDLKKLFIQNWIPKEKIKLTKIDLETINESWIDFIKWDLEYEDFLIDLVWKLWIWSQWIIFMNQVSQYLWDRLKIIKFISEFLLKKWWKFYFNLVLKSFYSWSWIPLSILESALNEIMIKESEWFEVKPKSNTALSELRMYEITKTDEDWELEMPKYSRIYSRTEFTWFNVTAYDFRYRMSLEKLREILKNKWLIKKIINPED